MRRGGKHPAPPVGEGWRWLLKVTKGRLRRMQRQAQRTYWRYWYEGWAQRDTP